MTHKRLWIVSAQALPVLSALASLAIAGCTAGPDFKPPAAPDVASYTAHPVQTTVATPDVAGGEAQRFADGGALSGDWWTLFHSDALDRLIEASLANNHDLKAAQAALSAAHENVLARRGASLPTVTVGFSATHTQQSNALAPTPSTNALQYSLFTPQVGVAYSPDVFGLARRTTEGVKAQEDVARYQMTATYIALAANVAAAAIQDASLRDQIAATRELIAVNTKMVETLRYQLAKGYAGGLDLAAQQSQLAQISATLPPLLKQSAQQHDLLSVLVGRYPSQTPDETLTLSGLQLPRDIPVSLPSVLVAQRPDILQAEANMHLANAQVGVAAANRLPNIALTADAGSTALALGQVFGAGNGFWDLGAAITAPIFDGGTLRHQEAAAKASYVQAAEQYRSTVLTAFQNVADSLVALEQDAEGLKAAAAAADAAKTTLDLSQRQYSAGYAGYLALLSAEQAYQQARLGLVQAQASRLADTAALFQALGGGWWTRADLARDKHES